MGVQSAYTQDPAIAIEGALKDSGPHDVITMRNNDTAEIAFGHAVVFEGSTNDQGALSPDDILEVLAGILVHSNAYSQSELGSTGVVQGAMLNVLRKGRISVVCADGCSPGDRLHVRALTGTEGELLSAADGINTIDATSMGVWLTTATAGNLATLEVDFTNKP
jgi:hypothetical protein